MELLYLILILLLILVSAFFNAAETSMVSLQRVRLENLINKKVKGAGLVAKLTSQPERLLSTVLTGNELAQTALTSLATVLAISLWGPEVGVLVATVGITVVLLIFCDTTPKTLAVQHSDKMALTLAPLVQLASWILKPFVVVVGWIAAGVTRLIGGTPVPRSIISEEEIRTMISLGSREGTVETEAAEMLHNVFDFGDRVVREVMVPRLDVIWVEKGTTVKDFLKVYTDYPLTRFPVYEENMDNVVGVLSIKDLLMAQAKNAITPESPINELLRPAYFAPESKPINELFVEMRDNNYRMAVVVDEFGGTAGIVSMNQLVEEIVGPVGTEMEMEKDYEIINENTFQIDGSMRIDEANEKMGLGLPEGDYETIAGFLLHLIRHIPKQNEQIRYKGLKFIIARMRGVKIEEVLVIREKAREIKESTMEKDAAAKS